MQNGNQSVLHFAFFALCILHFALIGMTALPLRFAEGWRKAGKI
jgi:hypothetical protein